MYRALYRKYRPSTFDDVCGQEHITSILKYQCETGKHSHAYLFCGTRGTGKTSCSKILAKAINCLSPENGNPCGKCANCVSIDSGSCMDVVEMDAASNNGIDDIRDIRDEVVYTPSELKYKVYIIDEVHMLSINAFNGLLKTLEEPPSYVVFILATTEIHKLPTTIVSRCQRYDFRKLSNDTIVQRLEHIAKNENIDITLDAMRIIARLASGGMRDAISLFELCSGSNKKIDENIVCDMLGVSGVESISELVCAIKEKNYERIFGIVSEIENSSKDISVFWQDVIRFFRDMLVYKTLKDPVTYLEMSAPELSSLKNAVIGLSSADIIRLSKILDTALPVMQRAGAYKRNVAEMTLIRMCDASLDNSSDAMIARINDLESKLMRLSAAISDLQSGGENISLSDQKKEINNNDDQTTDMRDKKLNRSNVGLFEKEPEFVQIQSQTQNYKILPYWDDVINSVRSIIPTAKGFIDNSEARLTDDGDFVITVDSEMTQKILSREKARNALSDAISFYEGRRISDACITFVVDTNIKKESAPIDELL